MSGTEPETSWASSAGTERTYRSGIPAFDMDAPVDPGERGTSQDHLCAYNQDGRVGLPVSAAVDAGILLHE